VSSLSQSRCVILKLLLSSNYDCFLSFLLLFCVVLPLIPHKQAQNLCFQPFSSTLTSNDNSIIFSVFSLFILLFIQLFLISHISYNFHLHWSYKVTCGHTRGASQNAVTPYLFYTVLGQFYNYPSKLSKK